MHESKSNLISLETPDLERLGGKKGLYGSFWRSPYQGNDWYYQLACIGEFRNYKLEFEFFIIQSEDQYLLGFGY